MESLKRASGGLSSGFLTHKSKWRAAGKGAVNPEKDPKLGSITKITSGDRRQDVVPFSELGGPVFFVPLRIV
jgi:hypothetical protein